MSAYRDPAAPRPDDDRELREFERAVRGGPITLRGGIILLLPRLVLTVGFYATLKGAIAMEAHGLPPLLPLFAFAVVLLTVLLWLMHLDRRRVR